MPILEKLKTIALKEKRHIVLPEGDDERTIEAAAVIINEGYADITILGDIERVSKSFEKFDMKSLPEIVDPERDNRFAQFVKIYYEKRKEKGMTLDEATMSMKKPLFFGAMMVHEGYAHGSVAGAKSTSSDVLRAGLRVIGVKKGVKVVSSFMIMETNIKEISDEGTLFFADVAVNPAPDASSLADIAIATADTWELFMDSPARVALLSFSTKGSADAPSIDTIRQSLDIVKSKRPDILIDGELQLDAAVIDSVGKKKAPGSPVAGSANVLIFPDLNSANIGYKLVERFSAGAKATGPILQGLGKPINDLSRGCDYHDIVNTCLVTIYQSYK